MLNHIKQWCKNHTNENVKMKRERAMKKWLEDFGFNWSDVESLLFWKDPCISLFVVMVFTGLLWKFMVYKLQRFSIFLILSIAPLTIHNVRVQVNSYLTEKLGCVISEENRKLGFNLDDVCTVTVNIWTCFDEHYKYLLRMKKERKSLFVIILVGYSLLISLIFIYIPIANVLYTIGVLVYFYPVLNYLGVFDKILEKLIKLTQPVSYHWSHNQTKRKRYKLRKAEGILLQSKRNSLLKHFKSDSKSIEYEQFVRNKNVDKDEMLISSHGKEFYDELELHNAANYNGDDSTSDFDESSFPSDIVHTPGMPSISQFDSLMEPLDDDFHAGLDFNNVTPKSYSDFGIPSHYKVDEIEYGSDTDEDIEDIPIEQTDGLKYAKLTSYNDALLATSLIVKPKQTDEKSDHLVPGEPDYEFLDRRELADITDKEINEQASQSHIRSIRQGVVNYLRY